MKMTKAKQDAIKDVGGFVGGRLKGGRRKKDCVEFRIIITLDIDHAVPGVIEQIEMLYNYRCFIYSTHKHTPENPTPRPGLTALPRYPGKGTPRQRRWTAST